MPETDANDVFDKFVMYKDVQWRLDIEVSQRSCRNTMKPKFIIVLHTTDGRHELEADVADLQHVLAQLEMLLKSMRSAHNKKFHRHIKK